MSSAMWVFTQGGIASTISYQPEHDGRHPPPVSRQMRNAVLCGNG